MGEKFKDPLKQKLRQRVDALEQNLIQHDPELEQAVHKSSIGALFESLAEKCVNQQSGMFVMLTPTIAFTNHAAIEKRMIFAKRFHIHTILTVHNSNDPNLSQDTVSNDSIIFFQRRTNKTEPTRILNLDKFPRNDEQLAEFFASLDPTQSGELPKGWGEISFWPRERIERGDWTAAIWRSPELADAAAQFAEDETLPTLADLGFKPQSTGPQLRTHFEQTIPQTSCSFPILQSASEDGQLTIQSQPDKWYIHKDRRIAETERDRILEKKCHLLITESQDNLAARLVAVADEKKYVGSYWIPVEGLTADTAKALAVFLNSTPGRLQLIRTMARKLIFPLYSVAEIANIRVPDVLADGEICRLLKQCWEETRAIKVPQYRDGDGFDGMNHPREKIRIQKKAAFEAREEERKAGGAEGKAGEIVGEFMENPRPIWDAAVARVMRGNPLFRLSRLNKLRKILHLEPHISGKPRNQYQ